MVSFEWLHLYFFEYNIFALESTYRSMSVGYF